MEALYTQLFEVALKSVRAVFFSLQLFFVPILLLADKIDTSISSNQEIGKLKTSTKEVLCRGVILIPEEIALLPSSILKERGGLSVENVPIHGPTQELDAHLIPLYLGQKIEQKMIEPLIKEIEAYYVQKGFPFIVASVPPQNITEGILQITITNSTINQIVVQKDKWVDEKLLRRYLSAESGQLVNQTKLLKEVQFMNRNPFRQVDLLYSPGSQKNTTDLTLIATGQRAYRVYTGIDNTGVPTTGRGRVFAGLQLNRIFHLDHILFYQYTTSESIDTLQVHSLQYLALLSSKTLLNFFGGYSTVHVPLTYPNRTNHGSSAQGSIRYTAPLTPTSTFSHELVYGFDFKRTNNTVEFVDTFPLFSSAVNLTQFMAGYAFKNERAYCKNEVDIEGYLSPGQWLPDQTSADFSGLRSGATNYWAYVRLKGLHRHFLPKSWTLVFKGSFQWSSEPLLPSEQLGVGGYDTVRGYDERQLNADTGLLGTVEIQTPHLPLIKKKNTARDSLYFLLFLDGGFSHDKTDTFSQSPNQYLLSAGPGMRYFFDKYLSVRLDCGVKLHQNDSFTGGRAMIHFSFIGSY